MVGLRTAEPPRVEVDESLEELDLLLAAAGAEVVGRIVQRRDHPEPATFIGTGKLEELAALAQEREAHVVVFDDPLSPAQLGNIENDVDRLVLDRTQLILDIFATRAHSREGNLQVELAQLEYLLPRLVGRGVDLSRLGGGIGTRGPGETKLEVDRRKIRRRISRIRSELESVEQQRKVQGRQRRESDTPALALVGYTNAGKSTLFRALTGEEVLVSRQPFSTLDPLVRRIHLPDGRETLLSDTVGFINKLPPFLVAAFRATLEEVRQADLLLNVIDGSALARERASGTVDPDEQVESVEEVLGELHLRDLPRIDVLNKVDLLDDRAVIDAILPRFDEAVAVSAATGEGLDRLRGRLVEVLGRRPRALFRIPQEDGDVIAEVYRGGRVLRRWYDGGQVLLRAEVAPLLLQRYSEYVVEEVENPA